MVVALAEFNVGVGVSEFDVGRELVAGVPCVGTVDIGVCGLIRNLGKARAGGTLDTGRWVTMVSYRFIPLSSTKIPALRLQATQQGTHID